MLATSLAAALAILAPLPQSATSIPSDGAVPYSQINGATVQPRVLNDAQIAAFRQGLAAARARDPGATASAISSLNHPTARKLVEWALVDTTGDRMGWAQLSSDVRSLDGWPRAEGRLASAEAALDKTAPSAGTVLDFFADRQPVTIEGVIALAWALEQTSRTTEARSLVVEWWRNRTFDEATQSRILSRWSGSLTKEDHDARLATLLSGPHGPATRAMLALVSEDRRITAQAAMAIRASGRIESSLSGLTARQAIDPAVVLERIRVLRAAGREREGYALLRHLPPAPSYKDGQDTLWSERRNYFLDALQDRNWQAAYDAMNGHGFGAGDRLVDAEFFQDGSRLPNWATRQEPVSILNVCAPCPQLR